jgi:hypothetical protein
MRYSKDMMIDEVRWYGLEGIGENHFEKIEGDIWKATHIYVKLSKEWKRAIKVYNTFGRL